MSELRFSDEFFPGLLVVFCGFDGTGKTTLIEDVRAALAGIGIAPMLTKQPTDTVRRSEMFVRYVHQPRGEEAIEYRALSLLTVSDRVQHSRRVILPELVAGRVVLSDRYFFSALANLRARGYYNDRWIYEIARHIPRPDVTFFLEPGYDAAVGRILARAAEKTRFFDERFNRVLYEEFCAVRRMHAEGVVVNTSQRREDSSALVREHVLEALARKQAGLSSEEGQRASRTVVGR
jgi:dTMP kinase